MLRSLVSNFEIMTLHSIATDTEHFTLFHAAAAAIEHLVNRHIEIFSFIETTNRNYSAMKKQ